jgi:hypothetical protein
MSHVHHAATIVCSHRYCTNRIADLSHEDGISPVRQQPQSSLQQVRGEGPKGVAHGNSLFITSPVVGNVSFHNHVEEGRRNV